MDNPKKMLLQAANQLYKQKRYNDCLTLLNDNAAEFLDNETFFKIKGLALSELNEHNESVQCFVQAIKLNPLDPLPYVNIGNSLAKNLQFEEAEKYFNLALTVDPAYMEAIVGLGVAAFQKMDYEACERHFQQALDLSPNHVMVMTNLGNCYSVQGRYEEALTLLNKVIARDKGNSLARTNRGLIKLGKGNFESAWEDYEYRWDSGNFMANRFQELPRWSGPTPKSQNVLVWAEQGIGDEIMFGSIFNDLKDLKEKFFVECDPRLYQIFAASFPHLEFIPKGLVKNITPIQSQIPLASLGGIFRADKKRFTRPLGGFLTIGAHQLPNVTEESLAALPRPWIGVSWESYALTQNFRGRKSISAEEFSVLTSQLPGSIINLQFPNPHQHEKKSEQPIPEKVITLPGLNLKNDMAGLAALLKKLDHVVTIGNSVAHLCGAFGIRTDVLLPNVPDWRWEHTGEKSVWYESIKLRRNKLANDWSALLNQVATEIGAAR
ncbi:tetratricopeptide repeat protein [Betaproteobacteria bacterium LSUCC0115]|nr:tetratricopeptide repeat protein [Burkholderiales bacterium LSUCC0115]